MADDNQVGVVGRNQATDPAQAPQRGMPGVPQPPRPTPEETQRVIQLQQQRLAAEAQEAARRAAELAKSAVPGQPVHGMQLPPQQIPSGILAQMPPQMAMSEWMQAAPVAQGPERGRPDQHSGNQFERRSGPAPTSKIEIPWFPIRGKGVSIELQNSIIKNLPEKGMREEGDAAARVVLALFDEVLELRDAVRNLENFIESGGAGGDQGLSQRVYQLEMVLFEQRRSMSSRARSVREQVQMLQAKGLSSDEIIQSLQDQAARAEAMVSGQGED